MNHNDLQQPHRRDERERVICMRCGEKKAPGEFHKATAHSDGKQAWCKACFKQDAIDRKTKPDVDARIAAADIVERRQVLIARHEAGKEHLPDHCPLCPPRAVLP